METLGIINSIGTFKQQKVNQQIKNNILAGFGIGLYWAACYVGARYQD